jgi:phosphatidylserine decarboxylase
MKEHLYKGLDNFCASNTFADYIKFVKAYDIDVNKYVKKSKDTFKSMFARPVNITFRPQYYEPYLNNLMCTPVDGRITAFDINENTKIKSHNYANLVSYPKDFLNGSGFISRLTPMDYPRIHVPYAGDLFDFAIVGNYIKLGFDSTYFMPPNVHEREYLSVIYGNNMQMSRIFPELVEKQPHIKLRFYVIIFCNKDDSFALTNTKFQTKDKVWFEQGEEIGTFNCSLGDVVVLVNRPLVFAEDIKYYSGLDIECYIRAKDFVGLIQ